MNSISPFSNNNITDTAEPSYFVKTDAFQSRVITEIMETPENSIDDILKKNFTDLVNKGLKSSYVDPIKRISKTFFTNSKFNNIPRNKRGNKLSRSKRSGIVGIRPRSVSNSAEEIDRVVSRSNFVPANQLEQNSALTDSLEREPQKLEKNEFYPAIFTDIKTRLVRVLEGLQTSQTDEQWKELARDLKDCNRYKRKASLDYNLWQDVFKNIFETIAQNRITTKDQFDVFVNWVDLVKESTSIGLKNNPNQAEVYLTRLHEILMSSNEAIQEGVQEKSNILFSYEFFKTLPVSEYEKLRGKLVDVIHKSFNTCEKTAEKSYYYFIRNVLLSCKNLIQSTEKFALKEDVLSILKDQFKNFYQQTTLTIEQQTIVKQLSYLTLISTQEQRTSLSEFCQEFAVKDMYPYQGKVSVENMEISIYSAFPLDSRQFEHILEDLRKTHASFKNAFNNLMDTKQHKINIFIAKNKSSYETFNYLLLGTATGNGGVFERFTPPILNGGEFSYSTPPTITVFCRDGRIHNLEHEYNHALFDRFINFREDGFENLLTKYNFNWLNEGLSYVLDPNYSGREDCKWYLTRNKLPKIESIITALNQDYTISYVFTEYLLSKKKPMLVEILTNIKNERKQLLKSCLEALPSLESEFLAYVKEHWSLHTIVTTKEGVEYDVKIKIDQILKELQGSQTNDTHWGDLATTLEDLGRQTYGNNVNYNLLEDSFEGLFQAISRTKITTKFQFDTFKNWVHLVSDASFPASLQEKPSQAKVYLSQLYEVLTSSSSEIQNSVDNSVGVLFYYDFCKKLSTPAYTELKQKLEDVIQATFKKCESFARKNNYYPIQRLLNSYEELIQSIKKFAYKEEILNTLKNQFEAFYQQTKLTAEQQTTIRRLSYIILTSARQKDAPLSEFCQKFTFKDMYPYEKEMSIENIGISIYSALLLNREQVEYIQTLFKQIDLRFKTVFYKTATIKTSDKVNLLIAKDESSYFTYYSLLKVPSRSASLDYLPGPTAGIYEMENRLLNAEYAINDLLYKVYIESPITEYGEYKFEWFIRGLPKILISERSNLESEILTELAGKKLPNIEKIIKGSYQDDGVSLALTYYLYEERKQSIDKILFYRKTGENDLLEQELIALTSLDEGFNAFWSARLKDYQIQQLQDSAIRYAATTSAKKGETTQRRTPSKDAEVFKRISISSTQTPINSHEVPVKDEITYKEWTPAKGWKAVKNIAKVSAGISYTMLAAFLTLLVVKRKDIKSRIHNSRRRNNGRPRIRNPRNQQALLAKPADRQDFHQKDMHSSQRRG